MVLEQARQDIIKILKQAGVNVSPADIVFPPNPEMGDLSLPLFAAAKERKVAPGTLAQEIARTAKPKGLVERIEAAGPYINFWLRRGEVVRAIITPSQSPPYLSAKGGSVSGGKGEKKLGRIMMEMVSPNNNKPLHLGHLRNAFLGESVCRLLEAQGAKVVRACLFNDRGLHIAKAMVGYKLWAKGATPETAQTKGDQFVVQWYVRFEQEGKKQSDLMKQAEELVRKWEAGDKKTLALWKEMAGWALEGINATLQRLGIKFDAQYFESKLWKQGKKMVEEGIKKRVFKKDETGAVVAEFDKLPPKVLLRSDGTAIYATSDLTLTPEKFKKYKLNRAIWCVGQEQDLYLKQLFAIMKMLDYPWAKDCPSTTKDSPCRCEHLTYGLVNLPEGRMKTREGTVVEADPLLDHMVGLAREAIKERHAHLTKREIEERAEIIAQAAVRYYLLKVGPKNPVNFDPKASIAFTGDTGPYLLYTYARIASILRKSQTTNNKLQTNPKLQITNSKLMLHDLEWSLIMSLARFPEIVAQSATDRDPSHLAKYLFELAQTFSAFYEKEPVLKAEEPIRSFRLSLIKSVQATLKQGLRLLTIDTVEEM